MTQGRRFDFFPLGANEAHFLLDLNKKGNPDIVVESNLVLIYPFGRLFFVNKEDKELKEAVEKGLKKAFENGSFLKLFKSHESNKALFEKANLENRKQILIDNPNMSEEFKAIPKEYFFKLEMLK